MRRLLSKGASSAKGWPLILLLVFSLTPGINPVFAQFHLDSLFGNNGKVELNVAPFHSASAVQPYGNDKVVVVGQCGDLANNPNLDVLVARMDVQGQLDPTFGDSGWVKVDFDTLKMSTGLSVQVLPDGKLMIMGEGFNLSSVSNRRACLHRLLPNGQTDSTFGTNGTLVLSFFGTREYPKVLQLDSSQHVLYGGAGIEPNHGGTITPTLARMEFDGTPDSSLGGTGFLAVHPDSLNYPMKHLSGGIIYDILPLPSGKLMLSGTYSQGAGYNVGFISRLDAQGTLDSTFNGTGTVYLNLAPPTNHQINRLRLLPNGEVLFSASSLVLTGMDFMLGKISADGASTEVEFIEVDGNDEIRDLVLAGNGMMACGVGGEQFGFSWFPDRNNLMDHQEFQIDVGTGVASEGQAATVVDGNLLICAGRTENGNSAEGSLFLTGIRLPTLSSANCNFSVPEVQVSTYPNPATDLITIDISEQLPEGSNLKLVTAAGKIVLEMPVVGKNGPLHISTQRMARGMYYLFCESPLGIIFHRKVMLH